MITIDIPQIQVSQEQGHGFHKDYLYLFSLSQKYGRLNLRSMQYAASHNYLNEILRIVYIEHGLLKEAREKQTYYSYDLTHYTFKISIETIIYWLRKTCDEIISLYYFAEYYRLNDKEPSNILIDCIGRLMKEEPEFKKGLFSHLSFLSQLNDVSNSYKHSFVNHEANHLIGIEEPAVVAFELKHNNSNNDIVYHSYSLKYFIKCYANFFEESAKALSEEKFHKEHNG